MGGAVFDADADDASLGFVRRAVLRALRRVPPDAAEPREVLGGGGVPAAGDPPGRRRGGNHGRGRQRGGEVAAKVQLEEVVAEQVEEAGV